MEAGAWRRGTREPRNPGSASLGEVGRTKSEGRIPCGKMLWLWDPLSVFYPGSSPRLSPPHRGKGALLFWGKRIPGGEAAKERELWPCIYSPSLALGR